MARKIVHQHPVTCLLISKEGNNTLSPEFNSPPSGSTVSDALSSHVLPASEPMPDTMAMLVDASNSSNESLDSQLTRSSISRNSSISTSHEFLQNNSGGGHGMKEQPSFQPDAPASDREQQQQHHCRGECPCITKALLAYQDININLNGRAAISGNAACPHNHHLGALAGSQVLTNKQGTFIGQQQVPVETALHCIKSSLETCEMLMDCQTCSARSECVMLSICMCDTMVARAEELVGAVDPSPSSLLSASVMDLDSGAGNKAMPLDSNQTLGSISRAPQRTGCGPTCGPSDQRKIRRRHHCWFHILF